MFFVYLFQILYRCYVALAIHFDQRLQAFIKCVLKCKDGMLGDVEHYIIRVEYQHRGYPHAHMMVLLCCCDYMVRCPCYLFASIVI